LALAGQLKRRANAEGWAAVEPCCRLDHRRRGPIQRPVPCSGLTEHTQPAPEFKAREDSRPGKPRYQGCKRAPHGYIECKGFHTHDHKLCTSVAPWAERMHLSRDDTHPSQAAKFKCLNLAKFVKSICIHLGSSESTIWQSRNRR